MYLLSIIDRWRLVTCDVSKWTLLLEKRIYQSSLGKFYGSDLGLGVRKVHDKYEFISYIAIIYVVTNMIIYDYDMIIYVVTNI